MHEAASEMFFMRRALALASRSCGHTRPNPPVGAVVVKEGRIIGEGRHVRCGADHAETAALKSVKVRGGAKDATVYVTLEPCSREGRVGACCDALIAAGVLSSRRGWVESCGRYPIQIRRMLAGL